MDPVSILIAVVGWALAIVLFIRSKVKSRLCYVSRTISFTSSRPEMPDGVEIHFRGRVIPRVAQTDLIIWNGGDTTLDASSLVEDDPARLYFGDDVDVLRAEITESTQPASKLEVHLSETSPSEVFIKAAFLEPTHGAVLTILHTGTRKGPVGRGTIKGFPKGVEAVGSWNSNDRVDLRWYQRLGTITFPLFIGVLCSFAIWQQLAPKSQDGKIDWNAPSMLTAPDSGGDWTILVLMSLIVIGCLLMIFALSHRKLPKRFLRPGKIISTG